MLTGLLLLTLALPHPGGDDSAAAAKARVASYAGLFGPAWSARFAELWNGTGDSAAVLGGIGSVQFVSISRETLSVTMNFDSLGRATVLAGAPDTLPTFRATLEKWAEFMDQKFGAISGVLTGKIKYTGPLAVAFKYGHAFDSVAPVGKRASESTARGAKKKR